MLLVFNLINPCLQVGDLLWPKYLWVRYDQWSCMKLIYIFLFHKRWIKIWSVKKLSCSTLIHNYAFITDIWTNIQTYCDEFVQIVNSILKEPTKRRKNHKRFIQYFFLFIFLFMSWHDIWIYSFFYIFSQIAVSALFNYIRAGNDKF